MRRRKRFVFIRFHSISHDTGDIFIDAFYVGRED